MQSIGKDTLAEFEEAFHWLPNHCFAKIYQQLVVSMDCQRVPVMHQPHGQWRKPEGNMKGADSNRWRQ